MKFKLLMVFVEDEKTDRVLTASREAGATGATIITSARGQGLQKSIGILGLEILNPRDVLLILVEARRADEVLQAVNQAGGLDESLNTGIALLLDVDMAVCLTEHVRKSVTAHPSP